VSPNAGESSIGKHISGSKAVMNRERTGIDIANGVDQADDPPGSTQVQSGERLTEPCQVEEGVTS
jgi:hypothetical protein